MASNDTSAATLKALELQQKYTELLEKRIAQLEGIVNSTVTPPVPPPPPGAPVPPPPPGAPAAVKPEDKKDENEKKPQSRYRSILRKWDSTSGSHKDEVVGEVKKEETKNVAYTFRRVYDPQTGEKGAYSELDIEDEGLISLLRSAIGTKYPGINLDGDLVSLSSPFAPIVHHWDNLQQKAKENPDTQANKDLMHLLNRVQTAPELEKYFKSRETNVTAKITTFETLWTCFGPRTKIVAKPFMNTPQILEVLISPIPYFTPVESTLPMYAWGWDWNGKKMVKVYYELKFERFRGTKSISELPFYPIDFHSNKAELLETIRARNKKWLEIIHVKPGASQMFKYSGNAYADRRKVLAAGDDGNEAEGQGPPPDEPSLPGQDKSSSKLMPIKGEFISDAQAFLQYGSGEYPLGEWNHWSLDDTPADAEKAETEKAENETADEDLLYPPRALGYATREKVWGQFAVETTLEAPGKMPSKFHDNLQLDQKYKDMIEALVASHESNQENAKKENREVKDVVQNKGKGLVLLLHGPPGVGKTLTAETIAEATGKPLFIVSVAEIGLNASRAERNLDKLFNLASKWEAILLVDEADVFLETRGSASSAGRNALVSVLLRVLEYYQGIIILTTNRIKSIDVAVISRIHLAIRYTDLTEDQMQKIFKFFLDQLEPENIWDREAIDDFIKDYGFSYKLNGRQIRNVVSGAFALASSSKAKAKAKAGGMKKGDGKLTFRHLKDVCEMTRQFETQLQTTSMEQRFNNEAK